MTGEHIGRREWMDAIAGICSHGGHGWDGDTCDDIPDDSTRDFEHLLHAWRHYLAQYNDDMPASGAFVRAVRTCADQLEDIIRLVRARAAEDEHHDHEHDSPPRSLPFSWLDGPWHCGGCGEDYHHMTSLHTCPVTVYRLRGGIGIYGLDWAYDLPPID